MGPALALLFPALLAVLPAPGGRHDLHDLHDLVPELGALDGVADARLVAIEGRLARHVGLAPGLSVRLTLGQEGGGRLAQAYALEHGHLRARLVRPERSGTLCELRLALDGERVFVDGLCFLDPAGATPETRQRLRGGAWFPVQRLPLFFLRLSAELQALDAAPEAASVRLCTLSPQGGVSVDPCHAWVQYGLELGAGERQLRTVCALALCAEEEPAPPAPEGDWTSFDGRPAGPPATWRTLVQGVRSGLELLGRFEGLERGEPALPATLARVSLRASWPQWDQLEVELELAADPLGTFPFRARVWRDSDAPSRWRVGGPEGGPEERSLELDGLQALLRAALERAPPADSLAVLAAARAGSVDVALALFAPRPLQEGPGATLLVLRRGESAEDGALEVLERTPLAILETPRGPAPRFRAQAPDGSVLSFELARASDVAEDPARWLVRWRELALPLLCGTAARAR